jgi:signal transduction histidine kinase
LEPVEAIRSEVASISAGNASTPVGRARVPVPAGDDEIARLASTMNEMLDRLGATQERLQQVVADASHELRNPVAALRQSAEAALAHPESTNVQELAAEVLEESLRLQTAAEDLLLLARLDAAPKIPFAPVDLDDIVFATAKDLRKTATIDVDTSAVSAVRTIGDAWQLRRLVANLAANAGRHAATKVVFTLRRVGQEGVLHVDDDGEGIPAERREQVFERFARLDEARDRVHGGAGLGLAIVFAIATAHGGSVAALASPLGGARIEVVLPVDPL